MKNKNDSLYVEKIITVMVKPIDAPIFDERGTIITIVDEAAGEFLEITQNTDEKTVRIDREEWPMIRAAIDKMVNSLK